MVVTAIRYMGARSKLFLFCIFGFCAVEITGTTLYTIGIKGVVDALQALNTGLFWKSLPFILLTSAIWWVYAPFSSYFCSYASKKAVRDTKVKLADHIVRLSMKEHDRRKKGELLSHLSNDAACLQRLYDMYFFQIFRTALGGLNGVLLMAVLDWRFAAVVFSLGSLSVLISARFSKKLEKNGEELQKSLTGSSVDIYELIKAGKTIRLLHIEDELLAKTHGSTQTEADARMANGRISAGMNTIISGVNALCYTMILAIGALFVYMKLSDWGTVAALMGLKVTTDMLFSEFGQFMAGMQGSIAGIRRIEDLMKTPAEGQSAACFIVMDGNYPITLQNVSFSYNELPVLSDFSMQLAPTGLTALIGQSGAGKSTVMKLITGLYKPDSGAIVFNGAGQSTFEDIRKKTAYVPQESMLFHGSINDNIAWGNPDATKEAVAYAAKQAGADGFITALPDGYETVLLDDGKDLSGGQRQRLAIARALLKNAPVLLLDEITSALDSETEAQILRTIKEISQTKPVLFITHKKEIEQIADKVYTL